MMLLACAILAANLAPMVEIVGDETCPAATDVASRLSALTAPDDPSTRGMSVHVSRHHDEMHVELLDSRGVRVAERSIRRSGSCSDMARVVALIVASWAGEIRGVTDDHPPIEIPQSKSPTESTQGQPVQPLHRSTVRPCPDPSLAAPILPASGGARSGTVGRTQRTVAVVSGGLGLASVVAGAIYGFAASSSLKTAEDRCVATGVCGPANPEMDRASSETRASEVYLAVGAGLLATGAIVYFLAPSASTYAGNIADVHVGPVATVHSAALFATGRF